jgi:hypothetical protein
MREKDLLIQTLKGKHWEILKQILMTKYSETLKVRETLTLMLREKHWQK